MKKPHRRPMTTSERMACIRSKNTAPEMIVRRILHSLGYRYRLHRREIPGTPDVVFARRRKVIQVHGCFWHQHPGCKAAHLPLSRLEYWQPKLARNITRDIASLEALSTAGWDVLVLWECEIKQGGDIQERLVLFLGPPAS